MPNRLIFLAVLVLGLIAPPGAHASFPGSNGKIAFASLRDGNYEIYTMNPDGSAVSRLTNNSGDDFMPAWSPDGTRIAFSSDRDGTSDLYTMNAAGGDVTHVTNTGPPVTWPSWSPDGTSIAFNAGYGIYKVPAGGGAQSAVIQSTCPTAEEGGICHRFLATAWSPDGQWISAPEITFTLFLGELTEDSRHLSRVAADGSGTTVDIISGCCVSNSDWSPSGGSIVFDRSQGSPSFFDLWTVLPDGNGQMQLTTNTTNEFYPAWSPDGTRIVFAKGPGGGPNGIYTMDPSGAGQIQLTPGPDTMPDWQPVPQADVLAVLTDSPDPVRGGDELHYSAQAKNLVGPSAATGVTLTLNLPTTVQYVSATPTQGSCSQAAGVVTCNLGTLAVGATASVDVLTEARNTSVSPRSISATATVGANETDPVPGNNSITANTNVIFGAYARPKSATPLFLPLVPAYKSCTTGEATLQQAPPLSSPSCANAQQSSGYLTIGTADSNMRQTNFSGAVRLVLLAEPEPTDPNNGDQSDIGVDVSMVDVRNKADLTDYDGELGLEASLRITDHDSGVGQFTSATVTELGLDFTVPCDPSPETNIGATCTLDTTYEAQVPGAVKEFKRAIWQLGQVRVLDGGADGLVSTGPNTVFAVQGVFAP